MNHTLSLIWVHSPILPTRAPFGFAKLPRFGIIVVA
jgi:hypothetical protein